MKRTITIALLLGICIITADAQSKVGVFFNQNFSTFRYKDSNGKIEDLDYTIKYGYGLSFQKVLGKKLFLEGFLSYNQKGANSLLDLEKLDWSFHYANLGINAGYKLPLGRISPLGGVGLYIGRLMKADQFIGSDYYDLLKAGGIKKNDFGANFFIGLEYEYSQDGSVFIRFDETVGLLQLETDETVSQKMFNRTFSIQIGLIFSIK
jgi:hypothetical protein